MIIKELYSYLKNKYELSSADARALLEFKLDKDFSFIIASAEKLEKNILEDLEEEAYNVQQGYPLAYVLNEQSFYKHNFYVDNNVLIPRSETEFLVAKIVEDQKFQNKKPLRILDIGAGSGCIGISMLMAFPESFVFFVEDSPGAVSVTLRNLRNHKIQETRYAICSTLEEVEGVLQGKKLDLIISNPPYIAASDARVEQSVQMYEPPHALYAEEDGLYYLKHWSEWAKEHIVPETGEIFFEFGLGQDDELKKISESQNWEYKILKDQYDRARFWFLKG